MRIFIRKFLSRVMSKERRNQLKHIEYSMKKRLTHMGKPMESEDIKRILTQELGVKFGDTVMVHAGLSLLNTNLSPKDIRDIILNVIGPKGNLVVPTFSPITAVEYMQQPTIFDAQNSKSGMGAIAETVRKSPKAVRSLHPTKSLAVIGPNAAEICAGHEKCIYPFGLGSPFEKLLERDAVIIGLAVPMSYLSFVHVAEDMAPDFTPHDVWDDRTFTKICRSGTEEVTVTTRVHNMATMATANPEKFCRQHVPANLFTHMRRSGAPFFSIRAKDLNQQIVRGFTEGFSIYD